MLLHYTILTKNVAEEKPWWGEMVLHKNKLIRKFQNI